MNARIARLSGGLLLAAAATVALPGLALADGAAPSPPPTAELARALPPAAQLPPPPTASELPPPPLATPASRAEQLPPAATRAPLPVAPEARQVSPVPVGAPETGGGATATAAFGSEGLDPTVAAIAALGTGLVGGVAVTAYRRRARG